MDERVAYVNTPQTAADMNSILAAIGQQSMMYWGWRFVKTSRNGLLLYLSKVVAITLTLSTETATAHCWVRPTPACTHTKSSA